ncbi:hypothetical protein QQF64_010826 [Cirrhinus molitorella]|uniref:Uncharacterized protein n=1 Tax=Cirrhinus molitorella TaxID=172907 RepID=A0ABR3LXG4_9TELE
MHSGHLSVLPCGIVLYKPLTESTTCSISLLPLCFSCDFGSNHQPSLNTGKGGDSHRFQGSDSAHSHKRRHSGVSWNSICHSILCNRMCV